MWTRGLATTFILNLLSSWAGQTPAVQQEIELQALFSSVPHVYGLFEMQEASLVTQKNAEIFYTKTKAPMAYSFVVDRGTFYLIAGRRLQSTWKQAISLPHKFSKQGNGLKATFKEGPIYSGPENMAALKDLLLEELNCSYKKGVYHCSMHFI